ncbi:hypothetical protein AGMMS49941_06690 [Deferribacterales bacterium]|nr:hypothetical protein AGMMS49941_06690 [Deferribacterales bacterium]
MKRQVVLIKHLVALLPILLVVLTATGCGYSFVRHGDTGSFQGRTFYLAELVNDTDDYTITREFQRSVTHYLQLYGLTASDGRADYILRIRLKDIGISSSIRSATREARTSSLTLTYRFILEDRTGKTLYDNTLSAREDFTVGDEIAIYNKAYSVAFNNITETLFTSFYNSIKIIR